MKEDICISLDMVMSGAIIKKKISKSGLSVREIQERMQLACPQPVYRWMKGQTMPTLDNLYTLSSILGVKIDDLLLPIHKGMWILHRHENDDRVRRMKTYHKAVRKNG